MRRLIEKKNILFLLVLIGTFVISFSVFALELDWPTSPGGIDLNDEQSQTITFLIAYIYEWAMVIGGLATFIALVSAGFQYLTSAGDTGKMGEARKQITSAITGLALLLSTFLILNTINPELTTLDIPEITLSTSVFEPLNPEPVDLSQPCDFARVWSEESFQGTSTDIAKYSFASTSIAVREGSLEFFYYDGGETKQGGYCTAELYSKFESSEIFGTIYQYCDGEEKTIIARTSDLNKTYEIKCVYVDDADVY